MEKTLYVTDLDGTLLRSDQSLSAFTVRTLNDLIEKGMCITYATARSFHSARKVSGPIRFAVPVITRNGCVFADQQAKKETKILYFSDAQVHTLLTLLSDVIGQTGFVTAYFGGEMRKVYLDGPHGPGFQKYVDSYAGDPRMKPICDPAMLFDGMVTYVTLIAEQAALAPVYARVKDAGPWECVFQQDTYDTEYWLEICPPGATKANAIRTLKAQLGCGRVVVFGDSPNDLSMFSAADLCCAVENADDIVKASADVILPSNDADGVAQFLLEEFHRKETNHG